MKKSFLAILFLGSFAAQAQLKEGKKNIDKLCGCFEVDFRYAETFAPDDEYPFHKREHSQGIELVLPIETSDKKVVLQHLLVVNDTMIVKHWREDWVYEQPSIFVYEGNKQWKKKTLPAADVKDSWVQTVWEVDDAPRYQGISQWVITDGKTFWQNTTDAPLPRREYTKRTDYNILKRGNRIVVTDAAWWHEQDNQKISRSGTSDKLIAEEKGMNYYKRIKESDCAAAKEYWKKYGDFWTLVRKEWSDYVASHEVVNLQAKVAEKRLDEYFSAVLKEWNAKRISQAEVATKLKDVIRQFTAPGKDVAAGN